MIQGPVSRSPKYARQAANTLILCLLLLNSEAVCRSGMRSDQRATPPGHPCPGGTAAHVAPFQCADLPGQHGLGDVQALGGATEFNFGDGDEVAQLAQVEIDPYSHGD